MPIPKRKQARTMTDLGKIGSGELDSVAAKTVDATGSRKAAVENAKHNWRKAALIEEVLPDQIVKRTQLTTKEARITWSSYSRSFSPKQRATSAAINAATGKLKRKAAKYLVTSILLRGGVP